MSKRKKRGKETTNNEQRRKDYTKALLYKQCTPCHVIDLTGHLSTIAIILLQPQRLSTAIVQGLQATPFSPRREPLLEIPPHLPSFSYTPPPRGGAPTRYKDTFQRVKKKKENTDISWCVARSVGAAACLLAKHTIVDWFNRRDAAAENDEGEFHGRPCVEFKRLGWKTGYVGLKKIISTCPRGWQAA